MAEDSVSFPNGALELHSGADSLSPDDLAWVDACLINDSDLSNADWSSANDAMVEIPGSHESSAPAADDLSADVSPRAPSIFRAESIDDVRGDGLTSLQPSDGEGSEATVVDVFQPHYREDKKRVIKPGDSCLDETEPSAEDIFRVWDLGIPAKAAEVDELAEQLNKALSGSSSVRAEPLQYGDSEELIGLEEEPLDELIAGITDLDLD